MEAVVERWNVLYGNGVRKPKKLKKKQKTTNARQGQGTVKKVEIQTSYSSPYATGDAAGFPH